MGSLLRAGRLGRLQGSASAVMISAATLAPLPLAALQQLSGEYTIGILAMSILPLLSIALIVLLTPSYHDNPGRNRMIMLSVMLRSP